MSKKGFVIIIVLLLVSAFLFSGCKPKQVEEREEIRVPVEVQNPVTGTVKTNYMTNGSVSAEEESFLGFPGGGRIIEMLVNEGDPVNAGQVLARVDAVQYREAVNAAQAGLNAANEAVKAQEASLDVSRNQLADAENRFVKVEADYLRFKSLYEDEVITQKEFEDIETAYTSAELGVKSAREGLGAAELQVGVTKAQAGAAAAQRDQVSKALSDTSLYAPYSGVIAEKMSEVGEITAPGVPVFRLTGDGLRKVVLKIPEDYHGKIIIGVEVLLMVEYLPDDTIIANVSSITPDVNPESRAFTAEIIVPAEYGLLPGSFVQAQLKLDEVIDAMTLPISAILSFEGGQVGVYVNEDGVARKRIIKTGLIEGDTAQVVEGLDWDDEVIVVGNRFLNDGAKIAVSESTPSAQ